MTNFFFKLFKIMRSLRSSKYLKTTVKLTFTMLKLNASGSLDYLFSFQLEIPLLGKFGPESQNYQLKLEFCV